jgi:hypothetical protein
MRLVPTCIHDAAHRESICQPLVRLVDADNLPKGGQDAIRRILFDDHGTTKTLLQLIQEKNKSEGKRPATS